MKLSGNFLVSIIIGLFLTLLLVYGLGIGDKSKSGPAVVVASAMIEAGTLITESNTKVMHWSGSDTPPESFQNISDLQGRVARQVIFVGEPILNAKLAPVGSKVGMESLISIGKRAITVRVNDVVGVAGFALPGSYVDIIANVRDSENQSYSKVVLERIKVLAVAQETEVDSSKPKVVNAVTLELSPEESEQLDLARSVGTLSLALRNELDKADVSSKGVGVNDLLNRTATVQQKPVQETASDSEPKAAVEKAPVEPVAATPKPRPKPKAKSQKSKPVEEFRGLTTNKPEQQTM